MESIKIAEDLRMSRIVIGIERLGLEKTKKECFSFIDSYLASGGNCIDTARLYGDGETDRVLGEWLRTSGRRGDVVLCTKGSHNDKRTGQARLSAENIVADLDDALRDLGIDHTDIHLLHRDNLSLPVSEIMPAVDRIVRSGKARAVGASNWTGPRIAEANAFARHNGLTPFSVSQIQYSLAVTTPAATGDLTHIIMNDAEYGWYKDMSFPVMAYSAQARGYFIKRSKAEPIKRQAVLRFYDHFPENHRRSYRLEELAKETGYSVASLCVAYVLCAGLKSVAIITVSNLSQVEDIFESDKIKLTDGQIGFLTHGRAIQ